MEACMAFSMSAKKLQIKKILLKKTVVLMWIGAHFLIPSTFQKDDRMMIDGRMNLKMRILKK